ncbi:hypothetical protein QBZ16_000596 [Prototheca wickerhamii]|uniref:Vacuolar protein sorting-associated protein 29 n=1 Tax=Prototheca wickerhamii TaxID=3111 RepID=A0AAD9IQ21_PROWI|nr:hypothetical protein QBZ16_000596 [Prototheca wickerhamii]
MLVLVIGDFHIPHRSPGLPEKFKSLLVPGRIHHVLCTGNLCNEETYDYLRSICSDVTVVQGDVDERAWPDTRVVTLGDLRVGLCHGHQVVPAGDRDAVAMLQREMDADVLVMGGSHAFEAYKHEGRFVINPGSATGAFHPLLKDPVPGFVLLDIDGTKLLDGDVKVDKIEFSKPAPSQGL